MHRIAIFETIDQTISLLEDKRPQLETISLHLQSYLKLALDSQKDTVLGIQSRVKNAASLRQKILRKSMYKQSNSAAEMLSELSDLIGLRIECRFLQDEVALFTALTDYIDKTDSDCLSYNANYPDIRFDLREPQPMLQFNGMPIYKIDGFFGSANTRFELQIKALVHVFWADVEHEIIYKNNAYMLMDGFMKEMLQSAYAHLQLVDSQLYKIYREMQIQSAGMQVRMRNGALEMVLAKAISDMFFLKMQSSLGFTINFKPSCDALSRYILTRARSGMNDINIVTMLFHRVAYLSSTPIDFESELLLTEPLQSTDPFCRILGEYFITQINADYDWNTFFRMLFALEPGNNREDMEDFIAMLHRRFASEDIFAPLYGLWKVEEIQAYRERLLTMLAESMVRTGNISIIYEDNLQTRENQLRDIVDKQRKKMGAGPLELPKAL